jgi:hypothetical protein
MGKTVMNKEEILEEYFSDISDVNCYICKSLSINGTKSIINNNRVFSKRLKENLYVIGPSIHKRNIFNLTSKEKELLDQEIWQVAHKLFEEENIPYNQIELNWTYISGHTVCLLYYNKEV